MHLWMYENDASMAQELEEMQDECSSGMVYEENRLREMIEEFPTWAELRARLALLLFGFGHSYPQAMAFRNLPVACAPVAPPAAIWTGTVMG